MSIFPHIQCPMVTLLAEGISVDYNDVPEYPLKPFDKLDMTLGYGQWPGVTRNAGELAQFLEECNYLQIAIYLSIASITVNQIDAIRNICINIVA